MSVDLAVVDAFTDVPFAGNPAGVCVLDRPPRERWMERVARELNLSETAFLIPGHAPGCFGMRWFTPTVEVDLCGHATLAAAHILWLDGYAASDQRLHFETRAGRLSAWRADDSILLDFPALETEPADSPSGLIEALGVDSSCVSDVARSRYDWLVVLSDAERVRGLSPDMTRLAAVEARGMIVTARADSLGESGRYHFVSRFFAPRAGVPEDPVTGSAHCVLGPYWARILGVTELVGYQASARGGSVGVRVAGKRVHLRGRAVVTLRSTLLFGPDLCD